MRRGERRAGGEGSDHLFRLLVGGKEAIGFMWDWSSFFLFFHRFIFAPTLPINCPLLLSQFFLSTHHSVHFFFLVWFSTNLSFSLPFLFCLSLSSHPTLAGFLFRALFLGLSNNPHITDLHLDISSCEVRSVGLCCSGYIHSSSS